MSELKGKDINEVIAEGMGKLASIPSGSSYSMVLWNFCHVVFN